MQQLGGMDAVFLYSETAQTPMHVAGLTLYDLPEHHVGRFHEAFRTFFASRLHLIPIFHKKLARTVFELDHPGWVPAGPLDLDYHIRGATLPSPGTEEQLEEWVAAEHAKPLDRAKPLWQFTVVEGLESGQGALYSKVHHAAIDGGAGMVITNALYDLTPKPRTEKAPAPTEPERKPTVPERAILGMHDLGTNLVRQQLKAMEAVPKVMSQMLEAVAGAIDPTLAAPGSDFVAPKTPFNVTLGRRRSYAARRLPLGDAKAIGKATDAKMNDVVMAICSGALRRYLMERQELPSAPLIAFVPVSLREKGDTSLNNQVFAMNCPLATDIADPLERLQRIVKVSTQRKGMVNATKDIAPDDYTLIGAPLILPGLMKLYGRSGLADLVPQAVNLCISNTMGPPFPLYCDGAQVTNLYPVSIATHGVGLNITVQSYMGNLDFGITAGRRAVPDPRHLADLLEESLAELKDAAASEPVTQAAQ